MKTVNLLLLTGEHQDQAENHCLNFYGKSDELGPVLLIFDQAKPLFFVDRAEKLPALDESYERKPVRLKSFSGNPVDCFYFNSYRALRNAADRFLATGVRYYESDVRPTARFLMERFIFREVQVAGTSIKRDSLTIFHNPKIKPAQTSLQAKPELVSASIDIETGVTSDQLYSIGVHVRAGRREENRVFMLGDREETLPENLSLYSSERALLQAFFDWFTETDPDLIFGWHVVGFDLMYLERKCRQLGLDLKLARGEGRVELVEKPGSGHFAHISGRLVIDGPQALRSASYKFPNFKLETVAQSILKTGKLITPNQDKIREIERQFREDKPALARYNLEDCVLVTRIFQKTKILEHLLYRSQFSGLALDQLGIYNAAFDHAYLPKLHRLGWVAPNPGERSESESNDEARRFPRNPGLYQNVIALQLQHVFPALIATFKIDPLGFQTAERDPIHLPTGHRFSASGTILPEIVERLMGIRTTAVQQQNEAARTASERVLADLCTAFKAPTNRFFRSDLAKALWDIGFWVIKDSRAFLESRGYEFLCANSESLFIRTEEEFGGTATRRAEHIARDLGTFWADKLKREYQVTSKLEIRVLDCFRSFVLPKEKTKDDVDKIRYAGLSTTGNQVVFSEMEQLVPNPVDLVWRFRNALFSCFFANGKLETWLGEFEGRLKQGEFNAELVYRKRLKKDVAEYGKNPPPHIRAARLLAKPNRDIAYVWTKRGPIPLELKPNDYDYDHYLNKQLGPVADLILGLQGKSFATIGQPEQMGLF